MRRKPAQISSLNKSYSFMGSEGAYTVHCLTLSCFPKFTPTCTDALCTETLTKIAVQEFHLYKLIFHLLFPPDFYMQLSVISPSIVVPSADKTIHLISGLISLIWSHPVRVETAFFIF